MTRVEVSTPLKQTDSLYEITQTAKSIQGKSQLLVNRGSFI